MGNPPLYVTFSVRLSVRPSVVHHISGTMGTTSNHSLGNHVIIIIIILIIIIIIIIIILLLFWWKRFYKVICHIDYLHLMCKMMISPEVFLFFFLKFWFFLAVRGVKKGKKLKKMKNNNYIYHAPYLKNSIAYDHKFWYTCVKWWYLQVFLSLFFFEIFIFWVVRGLKEQKIAQDDKKNLFVAVDISGTIYHMFVIYGTLV